MQQPILSRSVARALERQLIAEGADVHWVQVIGEDSLQKVPTKEWPVGRMLNVMIQHGWSEGTLLYVYGQADRYKPEAVEPLLRIKMLSSGKRLGEEIPALLEFVWHLQDHPWSYVEEKA